MWNAMMNIPAGLQERNEKKSKRLYYSRHLSLPLIVLPARYFCEKCRKILKKGPICPACGGNMTLHRLKMNRFRIASIVSWALAIFFTLWPFFTPAEMRTYFFLTFLFLGIAIAMEWFDARVIAIEILRAARKSSAKEKSAR
jgi:hypothetical protein